MNVREVLIAKPRGSCAGVVKAKEILNLKLVFSAHGVSPQVRKRAKEKNLEVFDATCPLVDVRHYNIKQYKEICILGL